ERHRQTKAERGIMSRKPPLPVCRAFLVCRQVVTDPTFGDFVLVGQPRAFISRSFPAASQYGFYARLTSGHRPYQIEGLVQDESGAVVWRDGPPEAWSMSAPLEMYDVTLNLIVVFPAPGVYDLVLTANGEEVARQRFFAQLTPQS